MRGTTRRICLLALATLSACQTPDRDPTPSAELLAYKEQHYQALPQQIRGTASEPDLLDELGQRRILILGDYHDDRALHQQYRKLLDRIHRAGHVPALLVEFVGIEDEAMLHQMLNGRLSPGRFRQRLQNRWPGSWMEFRRFDHLFYRKWLLRAQDLELPVRALEPIPRLPLDRRDAYMADRIRDLHEENPGRLLLVLVGHTHLLGEGHLLEGIADLGPLVLLPRANRGLQEELRRFASSRSDAWHDPYLVLEDSLWWLNPLPLLVLGAENEVFRSFDF